jgi:hypothetical protein
MGGGSSTAYYGYSGGGGGGSSLVQIYRDNVGAIKKIEATGGGGGGTIGYQYGNALPADGGGGGSWDTSHDGGVGGGGGQAGLPGRSYVDNVYQGSGGYPSNGNGSASITIYYIVPG